MYIYFVQICINANIHECMCILSTLTRIKTDTTQVGSAAWQREPGRYIVSSLEGGLVSSPEVQLAAQRFSQSSVAARARSIYTFLRIRIHIRILYVYMCTICIYVCVYVYVFMYIYIYYIFLYIYICISVYMCVCVYFASLIRTGRVSFEVQLAAQPTRGLVSSLKVQHATHLVL